jgi:hypothetical protein
MIKDTTYNLEIRLRRIEEKIGSVATNSPTLLQDGQLALQKEAPWESLDSSSFNGGPDGWLVEEIEILKQGLEVCKEASKQVQKIHIIKEVTSEGDST